MTRDTPALLDSSPPAPARLGREAVVASQRERMLRAMAEAVADKGYAHVIVADVVGGARVSRKTFYEHFDSLEACFLATFAASVEVVRGALDAALDPALPALEQGRRMIDVYLGLLASEPKVAKTNLVEVFAVGEAGARLRRASMRDFAALFKALHERLRAEGRAGPLLSDLDYELLVGAVGQAATIRVATGDAAQLPALAPELTAFVVRAFGAEAAA